MYYNEWITHLTPAFVNIIYILDYFYHLTVFKEFYISVYIKEISPIS